MNLWEKPYSALMGQERNIAPGTNNSEAPFHHPVMVKEVLDLLQAGPNKDFIDGTLGLGGHARQLLERSSPEGRLFGIDRDPQALGIAKQRLNEFGHRVTFFHGTFDKTASALRESNWGKADGMILDLGVSSMQLNRAERGFSFLTDSALDMRMDLEEEVTAREILNDLPEEKLEAIFREYGEERFSRRIARQVVASRRTGAITTTGDLRDIISRAVPFSKGRLHPATRVFQALRIVVNRELEILERFLSQPPDFLKVGGVLVVLSYHSLEDRIVKRAFRSYENFRIITKKPLCPSSQEIRENSRSRSAKLRAVQRIDETP